MNQMQTSKNWPVALALTLLTGCNTTSLEKAAPVEPAASISSATPPASASQANDPFMQEIIGSCRIKIANDAGVKTEAVSVGSLTPSPEGNGQFIDGSLKDGRKFRCLYDNIGNFLGAQPV